MDPPAVTVYSEADMDAINEGRCLECHEVDGHSPACTYNGGLGTADGTERCAECGHGLAEGEAYWAEPDLVCLSCAVIGSL